MAGVAGHGVLNDGEGPAWPPRPAPAQRRLLAATDRPIQYVNHAHPLTGPFPLFAIGGATLCLNCCQVELDPLLLHGVGFRRVMVFWEWLSHQIGSVRLNFRSRELS